MKLITLNTHSLVEENYKEKLETFVNGILKERPDVVALQEVNQSVSCEIIPQSQFPRYFSCDKKACIRADNHLLNVIRLLEKKGANYYWTYIPIKNGYERFDEGIGVMSLSPIVSAHVFTVSQTDDYDNWKRRKILGVKTEEFSKQWFYSVHYSWWGDEQEPFKNQWERTLLKIKSESCVWLMGDFNSPPDVRAESYDFVENSGFFDSFKLAKTKDSGETIGGVIDGWKDKIKETNGMRIDQIWCNKKKKIKSSKVIYNGENYGIVSDHYGVMIEL